MLFTVFLPIALISVWGEGTNHGSDSASKHALDVLDITMHLVTAVTISCLESLTQALAETYLKSISLWTEHVYQAFPDTPERTNVHISFHVFDFMLLFGPVRSWWCFPFERLIGHLGRLPHNHIPGTFYSPCVLTCVAYLTLSLKGDFESIISQTFAKASMLRRWLSSPSRPEEVRRCKELFDKSFASETKDYVPSQEDFDFKQASTEPIADDLASICGRGRISQHARWKNNEIVYSRLSTHIGNSQIIFFPRGDRNAQPVPGHIKYIYTQDRAVYFAVQQYNACPAGITDPFLRYPNFPARLYSTTLNQSLERIKLESIVGQFAYWQMTEDLAVILKLYKVSYTLSRWLVADGICAGLRLVGPISILRDHRMA